MKKEKENALRALFLAWYSRAIKISLVASSCLIFEYLNFQMTKEKDRLPCYNFTKQTGFPQSHNVQIHITIRLLAKSSKKREKCLIIYMS